jgi:hypothetical protein
MAGVGKRGKGRMHFGICRADGIVLWSKRAQWWQERYQFEYMPRCVVDRQLRLGRMMYSAAMDENEDRVAQLMRWHAMLAAKIAPY